MKSLKKLLFVITILILGIIPLRIYLGGKIEYEKFDSNKWINWTETEEKMSLRWNMMNSLRNNHELKGKTKNEIIKLLGKPNESSSSNSYSYYLGMSGHGIDTGSLIIIFNEFDTVTKYYVWHG